MAIPGYDPDDLDTALRERLEHEASTELLSGEELRAYEAGDDLVEALDAETIEAILLDD